MSRFKPNNEMEAGSTFETINRIYPKAPTVGTKYGKYVKGDFVFVPLFDISWFDNGKHQVNRGISVRFQYAFNSGSENKFNAVKWLDSGMRISSGFTYDDPGVTLGLDLPRKNRRKVPGFAGASDGMSPDGYSHAREYALPVLWNVVLGKGKQSGAVVDESGELALLMLTQYQFEQLKKTMSDNTTELLRWFDTNGDQESYENEGLGSAIRFKYDTGSDNVADMYTFSVAGVSRESHVKDKLQEGLRLVQRHRESVDAFEAPYLKFVAANDAGEMDDVATDMAIAASIVRIWSDKMGFDLPQNDKQVVKWFHKVAHKYSMDVGTASVTPTNSYEIRPGPEDDEIDYYDESSEDNITANDDETPF